MENSYRQIEGRSFVTLHLENGKYQTNLLRKCSPMVEKILDREGNLKNVCKNTSAWSAPKYQSFKGMYNGEIVGMLNFIDLKDSADENNENLLIFSIPKGICQEYFDHCLTEINDVINETIENQKKENFLKNVSKELSEC